MIQQQQSLELEELQKQQQKKLQSQLQALEEALSKRVEKMEQVTVAVEVLEEQRRFLLADQQQCALLQDRVAQLGEFRPPSRCFYVAFILKYRTLLTCLSSGHAGFQTQLVFILYLDVFHSSGENRDVFVCRARPG